MISELKNLAEKIIHFKKILFFTGAGISTSAGIPDFRGADGVWKKREPVFFDEFVSSEQKRIDYWNYKSEMWHYLSNAKPTFSHLFIKKLFDAGKVIAVVTQNIDGLHQKSGIPSDSIIELHGNNSRTVCMRCGKKILFEDALMEFRRNKIPPTCECGGILKPDVVMFGELLDSNVLSCAFNFARRCDLIICVGSTLSVQPASFVAYEAKKSGAFYALVNRGATEHDMICDLKIDMPCDDAFREIEIEISKNFSR